MSSINGNGTNSTSTTIAVDNIGFNERDLSSRDYAYAYDGASYISAASRRLSTINETELPPGFVPTNTDVQDVCYYILIIRSCS